MDFIYVVVVIGAPIGTGIYGFTVGQISALFALVMQVRSILASLSSSTEHMRIARYLIGELADLLNADLEFLRRKTDNSHQQFTAVRRAIKDLNVDQLAIAFYRLRFANTDFIMDGTLLKVTLEGQLPLGHMHGLGSDAAGHAAAEQLEIEHGLIIDLIAGTRVPIDGCVVMGPNLTVGVVPRTPVFISNSSLLENLKYGCRRAAVTPPEGVIWHVCHALGLPRHNFNPHGGSLPMGLVELSPTERQLMSIARTLLGQPDVLLVHNLGQLEPRVARRIGVVFSMYTQVQLSCQNFRFHSDPSQASPAPPPPSLAGVRARSPHWWHAPRRHRHGASGASPEQAEEEQCRCETTAGGRRATPNPRGQPSDLVGGLDRQDNPAGSRLQQKEIELRSPNVLPPSRQRRRCNRIGHGAGG
jgi:hypothetical protein